MRASIGTGARLSRAPGGWPAIRAAAVLAVLALAGCAEGPAPTGRMIGPAGAAPAPVLTAAPRIGRGGFPVAEATATGAERDYVMALLADLQRRSFAENREYCGYLGLDPAGRLMHTPPVGGDEASCPLPPIPAGMTLLASFHTHGTYSPWYASEWPTTQDVSTDAADGIDGYISTPGGRLWHVDTDTMTVRELCGRGCLPQDPNYRAEDDGPLRPVMSYDQLAAWERA